MEAETQLSLVKHIRTLCVLLTPVWIKLVNGTYVRASAVTRWRMTEDGKVIVYLQQDVVGVIAEDADFAIAAIQGSNG